MNQQPLQLTEQGIEKIINKSIQSPIVQIIVLVQTEHKKQNQSNSQNKYSSEISDGFSKVPAVLEKEAGNIISELNLQKNCIIQILNYNANVLPNKIVIISNIKPIYSNFKQQIGNPIPIDNYIKQDRKNQQGSNMIPKELIGESHIQKGWANLGMANIEDDDCLPLSSLNPMMSNNWRVKARVTQKSDIKEFSNFKGQGKLFSIEIIDEGQTEMKCTFFNEGVDKFYNLLEQGKVYVFSKGNVKFNTQKYSNKNDYSITFDQKAEISLTEDKGKIDFNKFQFTNIENIVTNEKLSIKGKVTFDVIGIIKEEGKVQSVNIKATSQDKDRKIVLIYDQTQYGIELTLWGNQAQTQLPANSIAIFKEVNISEFSKVRMLAASFTSQIITDVNQMKDLKEYKALSYWAQTNQKVELQIARPEQKAEMASFTIQELEDMAAEQLFKADDKIYCDIVKINSQQIISQLCSLIYVKTDGVLYYLACPNEKCSKKVVDESLMEGKSSYKCNYCNQTFDNCATKYVFSAKVADSTGSTWVSFYDRQGQDLLGTPAEQIRQFKESGNDDEIKQQFQKCLLKELKIKVIGKMDSYEGSSRIRYQAIRIDAKPNYLKECQWLQEELLQYQNM